MSCLARKRKMADLLLIHPPSYLRFREERRKYGPIADVVPSTPLFDMYPYGFLSMANYLAKRGYKVEIFNLAARMIMDPYFDLKSYIRRIEAELVGIDLHWMVHASGAIDLAKSIKEERPDLPIMLGGLSTTIFHEEILSKYDWIDLAVLGDTTEPIIEKVLESKMSAKKMREIPNLAYRDGRRIIVNDIAYVPYNLDEFSIDYHALFGSLARTSEPVWWIPFADFIEHPIGAIFLFKGCKYNCLGCGGSAYAYSKYFKRRAVAPKSPKSVVEEIKSITDYMKIPIFLVGDIQLIGMKNMEKLLYALKSERINLNSIFFEFFTPPPQSLVNDLASLDAEVFFQISPESHIESIRKYYGRPYGNEALENFIRQSIRSDVRRIDLYFLVGLPKQRLEDAASLPKYLASLSRKLDKGCIEKLDFFVAPLAPFIDPGSLAFDFNEKLGYRLKAKNLEDHVKLIAGSRDWRDMLNYETKWMSSDEIAKATYISGRGLLELKKELGLVNPHAVEEIIAKMESEYMQDVMEKETVIPEDLYPSVPIYSAIEEKSSNVLLSIIKSILGLE